MKICLILEGSYPYVNGGVSSWMHGYIKGMPEHEFVLWIIGDKAEKRGRFVYKMPENVTEIHEVFLDDALRLRGDREWRGKFTQAESAELTKLMACSSPSWDILFDLFQTRRINAMAYLQSPDFLDSLTDLCNRSYPYTAFSDTFHTVRSMLLPVLYIIGQQPPEADVYHAICTGYAGILACMGSFVYHKPVFLTEHGIYTREREEEIIRAAWVQTEFKKQWTQFFYMLSDLIYLRAMRITSLFDHARHTQIELGCPPERCRVIANGIRYAPLAAIPLKSEDGWVDIGAVVRMAPIKDIKTMLYAFFELSTRLHNVRLHILGGIDDPAYAQECCDLIKQLELDNVFFTGQVRILEYFQKLDFTILTSISEGQPLSVLESFAARRPVVTTDVGCCRELIHGRANDPFGPAGYCVPPMHREGLADAMEKLCLSPRRRLEMGIAGQKRVERFYRYQTMLENYKNLYKEVSADGWRGI